MLRGKIEGLQAAAQAQGRRRSMVHQGSAAEAVGAGSGGTDRAGLGGSGSQGTGRAQGNGHTRAAAGTGCSADRGAGLWNSGQGGLEKM